MSRSATGVKGVNLREGDAVVGARESLTKMRSSLSPKKDTVSVQLPLNIQQKVVLVKV